MGRAVTWDWREKYPQLLRSSLQARRMTPGDLAHASGVSKPMIESMLVGRRLGGFDTQVAIADALELPVGWVFPRTEAEWDLAEQERRFVQARYRGSVSRKRKGLAVDHSHVGYARTVAEL